MGLILFKLSQHKKKKITMLFINFIMQFMVLIKCILGTLTCNNKKIKVSI